MPGWLNDRENRRRSRRWPNRFRPPPGYLIKVLQDLTRAGILSAKRGVRGGFLLQRDPSKLTVLEVIDAIDPFDRITSCPLALDDHAIELCPLHSQIDAAMAVIEQSFQELTIQDVISQGRPSSPLCAHACSKLP